MVLKLKVPLQIKPGNTVTASQECQLSFTIHFRLPKFGLTFTLATLDFVNNIGLFLSGSVNSLIR